MTNVFQAKIAGHIIRYAFQYEETRRCFRNWLQPCLDEADITASPEDLAFARTLVREGDLDEIVEFKALCSLTGRALLQWDCCLFHSVAFLFRGRAWLLTAPSGTGKTTQFLNWRQLSPREITMISGDIPALERREDGIWVHPSPWNGKESIGSLQSAPLGGIVLLEQGKKNLIAKLPNQKAIETMFSQITFIPENDEEIYSICRLLDGMLNYPAWEFVNKGDLASTELLRQTLSGGEDGTV